MLQCHQCTSYRPHPRPCLQLNPFSLAFEKAAELAGILPESVLDASVVLIAADEVDLFLESLDDAFASVEQGRM